MENIFGLVEFRLCHGDSRRRGVFVSESLGSASPTAAPFVFLSPSSMNALVELGAYRRTVNLVHVVSFAMNYCPDFGRRPALIGKFKGSL